MERTRKRVKISHDQIRNYADVLKDPELQGKWLVLLITMYDMGEPSRCVVLAVKEGRPEITDCLGKQRRLHPESELQIKRIPMHGESLEGRFILRK